MAPATGYGTATITNPSGALTDFSLMIDLSTMHADWWTEQNDADGTKGRAYKNDGTTELAVDWIDFNGAGETGWARVKWSGTLASSGTQIVRIYPPHSDNAVVAAGDAFGAYNAYDANWLGYWPLHEDPSGSAPQMKNRISAGLHLTTAGTMLTADQVSGQVVGALDFDGGDDTASYLADTGVSAWPVSLFAWMKPPALDANYCLIGWGNAASESDFLGINTDSSDVMRGFLFSSVFNAVFGTTTIDTNFHHIAFVIASNTSRIIYTDGGDAQSDTDSDIIPVAMDFFSVGSFARNTEDFALGIIGDVQVHIANRVAAWVSEEYAQTNDQSAFWGSWGWTALAGGIVVLRRRRS